jgi:hypothetical protein
MVELVSELMNRTSLLPAGCGCAALLYCGNSIQTFGKPGSFRAKIVSKFINNFIFMKRLLVFLIASLILASGYSQQNQTFSRPSMIYLSGFKWQQGQTKLSSKELQKEISKTPAAIPYFKKGKTNTFLSSVFFAGSMLFTIAAIGSSHDYYYTVNHRRISYNVLAGLSFIASALTLKFALKNKGKAVHLRNLALLEL